MKRMRRGLGLAVFLCAVMGAAVAQPPSYRVGERLAPSASPPAADVVDLDWPALLPQGWQARDVLAGIDLASLSDNDPKAATLLAKLRAEYDAAPVEKSLDGKRVRIAGFVVTLERSKEGVREFLLVPYYGACIHTPPPPANQIIHVLPRQPVAAEMAIFPVYVSGVLQTKTSATAEGMAGYRIEMAEVSPYPWRARR